jgi:hypothetical protein
VERIGMLKPEVDDLDSPGFAPVAFFFQPTEYRAPLETTGPTRSKNPVVYNGADPFRNYESDKISPYWSPAMAISPQLADSVDVSDHVLQGTGGSFQGAASAGSS